MKTLLKIAYSDENRFKKLWDSIFPILGLFFFFFFFKWRKPDPKVNFIAEEKSKITKVTSD